jgi:hypothetical protein
MSLLKNLMEKVSGNSDFKRKFKQAEMEKKIEETIENRAKSSNERELIAYQNKMREDDIKKELDKIHKKQGKEIWKGQHNILAKEKSILTNDRPMLKEKNIFKNNKHIFTKEHTIKTKSNMGFFK